MWKFDEGIGIGVSGLVEEYEFGVVDVWRLSNIAETRVVDVLLNPGYGETRFGRSGILVVDDTYSVVRVDSFGDGVGVKLKVDGIDCVVDSSRNLKVIVP